MNYKKINKNHLIILVLTLTYDKSFSVSNESMATNIIRVLRGYRLNQEKNSLLYSTLYNEYQHKAEYFKIFHDLLNENKTNTKSLEPNSYVFFQTKDVNKINKIYNASRLFIPISFITKEPPFAQLCQGNIKKIKDNSYQITLNIKGFGYDLHIIREFFDSQLINEGREIFKYSYVPEVGKSTHDILTIDLFKLNNYIKNAQYIDENFWISTSTLVSMIINKNYNQSCLTSQLNIADLFPSLNSIYSHTLSPTSITYLIQNNERVPLVWWFVSRTNKMLRIGNRMVGEIIKPYELNINNIQNKDENFFRLISSNNIRKEKILTEIFEKAALEKETFEKAALEKETFEKEALKQETFEKETFEKEALKQETLEFEDHIIIDNNLNTKDRIIDETKNQIQKHGVLISNQTFIARKSNFWRLGTKVTINEEDYSVIHITYEGHFCLATFNKPIKEIDDDTSQSCINFDYSNSNIDPIIKFYIFVKDNKRNPLPSSLKNDIPIVKDNYLIGFYEGEICYLIDESIKQKVTDRIKKIQDKINNNVYIHNNPLNNNFYKHTKSI